MNFEALESFRIFADTLNFTRAAERRFLTQPALHKQIQNLEAELGIGLYGKQGRTLYLTAAGIKLARFARETGERMIAIKSELRGDQNEVPITLSAGRGSFRYLLGEAIQAFQTSNPGKLQVRVDDSEGTLTAIRDGSAQLGLTVLQDIPADLQVTSLKEVRPHLIVAIRHKLARRKYLGPKDLDGLPLIVPPDPSPLRETIRVLLTRDGFRFTPVMDAEGWELAMHFAALGLGAAVVNACCQPPSGTRAISLHGFPTTTYYLIEHPRSSPRQEREDLKVEIMESARRIRLFE